MNAKDWVVARVADANPVAQVGRPSSRDEAEAERVLQRVLDAAGKQRSARPRAMGFVSIGALAASAVIVVAVVALVTFGHGRPATTTPHRAARSGSFALTPKPPVRNPPAINVPPGMLVLASLGVHHGARFFIYGQRIRFEGRLYFCLFVGNQTMGSSQICPPWPLRHEPTPVVTGGFSPKFELAAAVAPRDETCTIVGLPGGPYRTSRAPIPPALKVGGDVYYSFVTFPGASAGQLQPFRLGAGYFSLGGNVRCHR
jgi:hypothetical protein